MRPYIITEDVEILMRKWTNQKSFCVPSHYFFESLQDRLTEYLKTIFKNVVMIKAKDLNRQLKKRIRLLRGTTIVSIDQIYNSTKYHLESNRIADFNTSEIIGEAERPGCPSLSKQIKHLPKNKPLVLVDDGCFSGATLNRIYELLYKEGLAVSRIVVGILIDRKNNHLTKAHPDVPLEAIYEYDKAIDWVCERDFFIGIPLSGRTAGYKKNGEIVPYNPEISLPYCLPFGDPVSTASIPAEKAIEFSGLIIKLSQKLWEGIEKLSGRDILCSDIPRLPKGIQRDNQRFVNVLQKAFLNLQEEGS